MFLSVGRPLLDTSRLERGSWHENDSGRRFLLWMQLAKAKLLFCSMCPLSVFTQPIISYLIDHCRQPQLSASYSLDEHSQLAGNPKYTSHRLVRATLRISTVSFCVVSSQLLRTACLSLLISSSCCWQKGEEEAITNRTGLQEGIIFVTLQLQHHLQPTLARQHRRRHRLSVPPWRKIARKV